MKLTKLFLVVLSQCTLFTLPEAVADEKRYPSTPLLETDLQDKGVHLGGTPKLLSRQSPVHVSSLKRPTPVEEPYSGQHIRLINYQYSHEWGVIEVYSEGTWGYVCADEWDMRDATVACRQLGFSGAFSSNVSSEIGVEQRAAHKIVMSEVRCSGTESTLQDCPSRHSRRCSLDMPATVECEQSTVCPSEWYPGFGKCYRLFAKAESLKLAASVCGTEGGSLVNIDSIQENHFLSNFVSNLMPDIHEFHTGGVRQNKRWSWYKLMQKTDFHLPRDFSSRDIRRLSRYITSRTPVREDIWFPGWPSHDHEKAEPSHVRGKKCLTLSNRFRDPYGRTQKLNYFFWKADKCHKRTGINFICQIELEQAPKCPKNEFYCPQEKTCIAATFRCDNEDDCEGGEDEKGCDYALSKFSATENKGLFLGVSPLGDGLAPSPDKDFESWQRPTSEMCAKNCLQTTKFVCRSFVYTTSNQTCSLMRYNSHHGNMFSAPGSTLYELDSQRNCTDKFQCNNMFCVDIDKICDGNDDCQDMSDEIYCHGEKPSPAATVSLVGGDEHSGTVELTYMNSTGVICDDQWGMEDASVICRMLGFRGAKTFYVRNYFNYPADKVDFLLDEVQCIGNETSIIDCKAAPFETHDCRNLEVAGVECQPSIVCGMDEFTCADETCVKVKHVCDGNIRCKDGSDESNCEGNTVGLVGGSTSSEGRVQITRGGLTGTVCDDEWDNQDATVVCRSLGMNYGGVAVASAAFGQGSGPVWMDNVQCSGLEESLDQCKHRGWGEHDCDHREDAGVRCFTSPPTPTSKSTMFFSPTTTAAVTKSQTSSEGTVELVGGEEEKRGNIAIIIDDKSYRVCDRGWHYAEATVVCRMLGYIRGGIPTTRSYFGSGDYEILKHDVRCLGTETSLHECSYSLGPGHRGCSNNNFAGVMCIESLQPTESPEPTVSPVALYGTCGRRPYDTQDLFSRRRRRSSSERKILLRPAKPLEERKIESDRPRILKIFGGYSVPHGKHPWQVGIRLISSVLADGSFTHSPHCGGTILSEYWVLSAAHCFKKERRRHLLIIVGDHNSEIQERGEQRFQVEEMILHKNFTPELDYDIALLKVKMVNGRGIVFNKFVQPACLPTAKTPYVEGTLCEISGWGSVESERITKILKATSVPLIDHGTCNYLLNKRKPGSFTQRMMCAGYLAGGRDTCKGDSGGPLVCKIQGIYTLMGITSWGLGCAKPNAPGVYALVQEFLPWINENLIKHGYSAAEQTLPPRPRTG